ncbi:uncharacterized protein [Battus philenor]|uniref:uncharacterized protein n=1 Tax=Battus philenor TaxID=42288 RepID=UPI0035D097A4
MEDFFDAIVDFIRVRQLNIAIAALLSIVYVAYQYRNTIFKFPCEEEDVGDHRTRLSRSRSRSYSRSRSRPRSTTSWEETKRRGRKPQRRCHNCSDRE